MLQASLLGLSWEGEKPQTSSVLGGTALLCPRSGLHSEAAITVESTFSLSSGTPSFPLSLDCHHLKSWVCDTGSPGISLGTGKVSLDTLQQVTLVQKSDLQEMTPWKVAGYRDSAVVTSANDVTA